jgi:hypothetical protein
LTDRKRAPLDSSVAQGSEYKSDTSTNGGQQHLCRWPMGIASRCSRGRDSLTCEERAAITSHGNFAYSR